VTAGCFQILVQVFSNTTTVLVCLPEFMPEINEEKIHHLKQELEKQQALHQSMEVKSSNNTQAVLLSVSNA
jgi:hypothetical protein